MSEEEFWERLRALINESDPIPGSKIEEMLQDCIDDLSPTEEEYDNN